MDPSAAPRRGPPLLVARFRARNRAGPAGRRVRRRERREDSRVFGSESSFLPLSEFPHVFRRGPDPRRRTRRGASSRRPCRLGRLRRRNGSPSRVSRVEDIFSPGRLPGCPLHRGRLCARPGFPFRDDGHSVSVPRDREHRRGGRRPSPAEALALPARDAPRGSRGFDEIPRGSRTRARPLSGCRASGCFTPRESA